MRGLIVAAVICVLLAGLTATAWAKDITGYKSGNNAWTLHAAQANTSLKGFVYQEDFDFPAGAASYYADSRTLQFRGVDKQASVTLVFWQKKLCGIVFSIDRSQMSFNALYDYFDERYGDNPVPMEDQSTYKIYRDNGNDFLCIVSSRYTTPSEPEGFTTVYYLSKDAIKHLGDTLPVLTGLDAWLVGKMDEHIK